MSRSLRRWVCVPAQGQMIEDRLVEYLESRTAVLVFDNCEHVMSGVAQLVERLLHAAPGLTVVATSREALMIGGEEVMPLGPLPVAASGESDVSDAVALFVERVRAESGSYDPDLDELDTVAEICRRLDGMPLAIELAAARARSLGVAAVSDRLGARLRLLGGGRRTSVGRHQTLQATLDWSYVLLGAHEQTVFDRLGVFVGWFTLDDAVAVVGGDGVDTFDVVDALSGLVDKSMVVIDRSHTPARYRYLETMRAYARDHLDRSGVIGACLSRHAVVSRRERSTSAA